MSLTYAELCAGYGGLGLAIEEVMGAELKWYSEFEAAPSKIMAAHWPDAPNHGDMTQIDWAAVEPVDIISGGTPCQDLSHAGRRAGMTEGTRSNLWVQMREAIATIKPTYVVWENVRGAYSAGADSDLEPCPGCVGDPANGGPVLRALGRVLGDLSDLGYDSQWRGLRAADVGAPHGRFRVFILATRRGAEPANADHAGSQGQRDTPGAAPTERHGHTGTGVDGPTADTDDQRGDRSGQWAEEDGWGQPADGGNTLADTNRIGSERRGGHGDLAGSPGTGQGDGQEWQRDGDALDDCGPTTADAPSSRSCGREDCGASGGDAGAQRGWSAEPERDGSERVGTTSDTISGGRDGRTRTPRRETLKRTTTQGPSEGDSDGINRGSDTPVIRRRRTVRGADTAAGNRGGLDGNPTEGRPNQTLQGMREATGAEEVRQAPRGSRGVPAEESLQPSVRKQSSGNTGGQSPMESTPDQGAEAVRDMRGEVETARPSQGSKPGEQLAGEPADTVRELPPEAALGGGQGEADSSHVAWGPYESAIRRWERIFGCQAPAPTEITAKGKHRLSARFAEFMMGLPAGWVTDVDISRNEHLKALGNGVVPQQAAAALTDMLKKQESK